MPLLSLLLVAAAAQPVVRPAAAPVLQPGSPSCEHAPVMVQAPGAPPRVRPLMEEPPARRLLTVADYDVRGCLKPRVVSEQVGPPARR